MKSWTPKSKRNVLDVGTGTVVSHPGSAACRYPPEDLSGDEITSIVDRLGASDPRLAICARSALQRCGQRDYQKQALARSLLHLVAGHTTAADVVLPTGTGKTYILSPTLLIAAKYSNSPVPCITPSNEIAEQDFQDISVQAAMFDDAICAARMEPYKFQLRWVVTQGLVDQLAQERHDLMDQLAAMPQPGQEEWNEAYRARREALRARRKFLKEIRPDTDKPKRTVLAKNVFR